MSVGYKAVQWNRQKIVYDAILAGCVAIYLAAFMSLPYLLAAPGKAPDWEDLRIKAFGSCAFFMITIILCIGPMTRLSSRFLPLLYNRRHFGVMAFCIAAMHGFFVIWWFASRGETANFWTEITTAANYSKLIGFTIKPLGLAALLIFFVMAATSHDYWLNALSAPVWKAIHMAIYAAYGLVAMHVALGAMQDDRSNRTAIVLGFCAGLVVALHVAAALRERIGDRSAQTDAEGWIDAGPPGAIPDKQAKIVCAPGGERIAVFRDGDTIGAVANHCAHQNGPLGEGRIVDGCITCPWHGWQYRLEDGRSPPPFGEKLPTYRVRMRNGRVEVHGDALAPGTPAALKFAPA